MPVATCSAGRVCVIIYGDNILIFFFQGYVISIVSAIDKGMNPTPGAMQRCDGSVEQIAPLVRGMFSKSHPTSGMPTVGDLLRDSTSTR